MAWWTWLGSKIASLHIFVHWRCSGKSGGFLHTNIRCCYWIFHCMNTEKHPVLCNHARNTSTYVLSSLVKKNLVYSAMLLNELACVMIGGSAAKSRTTILIDSRYPASAICVPGRVWRGRFLPDWCSYPTSARVTGEEASLLAPQQLPADNVYSGGGGSITLPEPLSSSVSAPVLNKQSTHCQCKKVTPIVKLLQNYVSWRELYWFDCCIVLQSEALWLSDYIYTSTLARCIQNAFLENIRFNLLHCTAWHGLTVSNKCCIWIQCVFLVHAGLYLFLSNIKTWTVYLLHPICV